MVSKIVGTKFHLSPSLHVKCHKWTIWVPILVTEGPYFIQIWVPIGSLFKKCLTFHQKAQKVRHKGWNSIKSEWKITNYPLTRTKSYVLTNSQTNDDDGNLVEPQFDDRLKGLQLTNKDSTLFSARNDHHKKDLKHNDHHEKENNGPAGEIQNQPNTATLSTFKMIVIHLPW